MIEDTYQTFRLQPSSGDSKTSIWTWFKSQHSRTARCIVRNCSISSTYLSHALQGIDRSSYAYSYAYANFINHFLNIIRRDFRAGGGQWNYISCYNTVACFCLSFVEPRCKIWSPFDRRFHRFNEASLQTNNLMFFFCDEFMFQRRADRLWTLVPWTRQHWSVPKPHSTAMQRWQRRVPWDGACSMGWRRPTILSTARSMAF